MVPQHEIRVTCLDKLRRCRCWRLHLGSRSVAFVQRRPSSQLWAAQRRNRRVVAVRTYFLAGIVTGFRFKFAITTCTSLQTIYIPHQRYSIHTDGFPKFFKMRRLSQGIRGYSRGRTRFHSSSASGIFERRADPCGFLGKPSSRREFVKWRGPCFLDYSHVHGEGRRG